MNAPWKYLKDQVEKESFLENVLLKVNTDLIAHNNKNQISCIVQVVVDIIKI